MRRFILAEASAANLGDLSALIKSHLAFIYKARYNLKVSVGDTSINGIASHEKIYI
jgi:hypothetical protein